MRDQGGVRVMREPSGALVMVDHCTAEGAQIQGGAEGLTGRGENMGLETWGAAREPASQSLVGGEVAQSEAEELTGVSSKGRAKELRDTIGAG